MKLLLDVWHCLLDVYTKFQIDISKHVEKSPENFSLAGSSTNSPFRVFLSAMRPKIAQPWRKSVEAKTLTISVCVLNLRPLYNFWGLKCRNAEKWLWHIFGCKVSQSVPIGMKFELDVWLYLLNVYTMFQNDISKHVEKKPGKLKKSKTRKNNRQNSESMIFETKRILRREVYGGPSTY